MAFPKSMMAAAVVFAACARLSAVGDITLYRVFLNDGTAVVSYGEYARVGDRVVFSMPVGTVDLSSDVQPALHMVNIPATAVDWAATTKYSDAARYAHYVATNAESDYAQLTAEVAGVLNTARVIKDPNARLEMAVEARRRLASWPREHLGYRAEDVREVLGFLDEVIAEMRATAGQTQFSLALTASPAADGPAHSTSPDAVMAAPTAAESIAQAVAIAKITDVPADRVSLLRAVVAAIDDGRTSEGRTWAQPTRRWAVRTINSELSTDRRYAQLSIVMTQRARAAAANADVRRVEGVFAAAQQRDKQIGHQRPEVLDALLSEIRVDLDAARRLRLARDRWSERAGSFRAYQSALAPVIAFLRSSQRQIDDIKKLAGADAQDFVKLTEGLDDAARRLRALTVPDELKPAHAVLLSSVTLAQQAARRRRQAVLDGNLTSAWDASSAAAGSMMLFTKAQEDMEAVVKLPQIR
jgi:hypothetical protein